MAKLFATLGAFAALLTASGCMGYVADAYPPPPPPPGPMVLEGTDLDQPGYRVTPKPNPRRMASRTGEAGHENKKLASAAETGSEKASDAKPLTPAEIRGAIPLQKVSNPQETLSDAQIKSVWGDVVGKVQSVDVSGGTLRAVDAHVSGARKVVRIDSTRLKYVRSRNVILTTMSKPDVEKLPIANKL